jgi:arabinose-5-phosphate isomerase
MSAVPETAWIPHGDVERLREARDILRDEGQALLDMSRRLDAGFCAAVEAVRACRGTLVVTGMGKAGHIGRKLTATFSSTGTRALFLHPAEAVHGDMGAVSSDDVVLALSHSGETDELNRLLPQLKSMGATIVAITARDTSTLGRKADVTIALGTLREAGQWGLAPTTSTTVMLAVGDALALVVSRERGFTRQQFAFNHPAGALGRKLCRVAEVMRSGEQLRIAPGSSTVRDVFVNMVKPGRRTGAVMLVDEAGVLVGLFTDSDLVRLLETQRENQVDRPIAEVMTANPRTIRPDALLGDAVELLARFHISELPVVDELGHPVGLIDITDVIGLIPEVA